MDRVDSHDIGGDLEGAYRLFSSMVRRYRIRDLLTIVISSTGSFINFVLSPTAMTGGVSMRWLNVYACQTVHVMSDRSMFQIQYELIWLMMKEQYLVSIRGASAYSYQLLGLPRCAHQKTTEWMKDAEFSSPKQYKYCLY